MDESNLVEGRACGECSACCVHLKIEEDSLKKSADVPCPHLQSGGGCGIYKDRPSVCRTWYCAWRVLGQLGDEWRPDRSGIILRFDESGGLVFQPIRDAANVLTTELALSIFGGGIASDIPLFISVPTKKGFCSSKVQANDALKEYVLQRDFVATKKAMIQLVIFASAQPTDPV
ncbi:YkgJ family cysteine cluster protein [Shewanella sp. SM34]|uniref:YkgJ family cysteine cluster protein n=1 Tax=unclassified Shewanella TaxID=196818 RepID=UPI0021D8EA2F|nr:MULTISPECIES: YkgJ family cysteine cluster protein [unclassified Shewanella]MCU8055421.1 YkgJ family cysteine cluster protein [Shewanella sp. SM35]MCU8064343.1 YkgJ family cysteine cluster protein [Shewanella sp. SM34]